MDTIRDTRPSHTHLRRTRLGTQTGRAEFLGLGWISWYDTRDITATTQTTLTNRIGTGVATLTNNPVALPHTGTDYIYLPGTTGNNLSIPKDGAWAGTLHITATLTDDTTTTTTTTADPILIGDTLLTAGRYKRFDVRDTDSNGTLRATIEPDTETTGQTTWTCTTGQTVTVNRSTTGVPTAIVTRPTILTDGSNDYIQLPTTDLPAVTPTTGTYTVLVAGRTWANGTTTQGLWSTGNGSFEGLTMYEISGTQLNVTARDTGSGQVVRSVGTSGGDGTARTRALIVDTGTIRGYFSDGATSTLSATSSITALADINQHTAPRWVSSNANSTTGARIGEHTVCCISHLALTQTQLDTASTYLLGTYP